MEEWGSLFFYAGLILAAVWVFTRCRKHRFLLFSLVLMTLAFGLPVRQSQARAPAKLVMLDQVMGDWQFHEVHETVVHAPAERVYRAIQETTPDEIPFYQTLTAIRTGFHTFASERQNILNAPGTKPIIDTAIRGGFLKLGEKAGQEIVIGAVLRGPAAGTPEQFASARSSPGSICAAMDFSIESADPGFTRLRTETRVSARGHEAERIFAAYWRVIYPGSSFIRHMWLRAIRRRAEQQR